MGCEHRVLEVFHDIRRLHTGIDFQEGFEDALVVSTVIMPIVSKSALEKMAQHDPFKGDNVLLEWILACHLWKINHAAEYQHPIVRTV
jgi:hypothetical protein